MTLPASNGHLEYTADGNTDVFPYDFRIDSADEIEVRIDDAPSVYGSRYRLTGVGEDAGGDVVYIVDVPEADTTVSVRRVQPLEQLLRIVPNAGLPAAALEGRLDAIVKQTQSLKEELSRRPAMVPGAPESQREMVMPIEASKVLAYNSTATGFTLIDPITPLSPITDLALIDDFSGSLSQFRSMADPGEIDSESLAIAADGEIARLRYALYDVKKAIDPNITYWYETPQFGQGGVNVKSFGAIGDGVAVDLTAIQNAFAANNHVHFPEGVYNIGDLVQDQKAFDLSGLGSGVTITTEGHVKILCNTNMAGISFLFYLGNNSDFTCGDITIEDSGGTPAVTWRGAIAFLLTNVNGATTWGNVHFGNITCINCVSGITCTTLGTLSTVNRIRGITVESLNLFNCYYGFNAQNEGDHVTIGLISAFMVRRAYFIYGVTGHDVTVFSRRGYGSSGQINIHRSTGGLDTHGITVRYTAYEDNATFYTPIHVNINHNDLSGGTISGIDITLSITTTNSIAYQSVRFVNYNAGNESASASSNYVRDIRLRGSCDSYAQFVDTVATYAAPRQMTFETGLNFLPTQNTLNKFQLAEISRGDTTVNWNGSTGDPDLGNGTLTYNLDVRNGMVWLSMRLVMGSTTTYGTGFWFWDSFLMLGEFINAKVRSYGSVVATDVSEGVYKTGVVFMPGTGSLTLQCTNDSTGLLFQATEPFTWAEGDILEFSILIPVSG